MLLSHSITFCLTALKQGLSLNLELGWWPASPLAFLFLSSQQNCVYIMPGFFFFKIHFISLCGYVHISAGIL